MLQIEKKEYADAIFKGRELGYTYHRIPNTGGAYEVRDNEGHKLCWDYELSKYFDDRDIDYLR